MSSFHLVSIPVQSCVVAAWDAATEIEQGVVAGISPISTLSSPSEMPRGKRKPCKYQTRSWSFKSEGFGIWALHTK